MISGIIVSLRRLMLGDKKSITNNCSNIINKRVEQANEDHCGCCQEIIQDTDENKEYE